jgi:hypothetical protein
MTQRKQTEAEREQEAALRLTEQTTEHDDYAAWCEDVLATALCYRYDPIAGIEGARVISHAHVGHGMGGGWVAGALLAAELEGGCGLAEDQEPRARALARRP